MISGIMIEDNHRARHENVLALFVRYLLSISFGGRKIIGFNSFFIHFLLFICRRLSVDSMLCNGGHIQSPISLLTFCHRPILGIFQIARTIRASHFLIFVAEPKLDL